ncbi:MAG: VanZ family protein [Eudoraea sp.]|nr:VanZ family protein [Eudoraea sp.]
MTLFKSKRERRLWYLTLAVLVAIYSTLGLGSILAGSLRERGLLSDSIWLGIFLVAATIVAHGLKLRPGKIELVIWLGIAAAYLFILIRMTIPEERSHLIEYSILAVFIHEALKERKSKGGKVSMPPLIAILATAFFGVIDESIQAVLPNRVFDPIDMAFNAFAGLLAIVSSLLLNWIRSLVKTKSP